MRWYFIMKVDRNWVTERNCWQEEIRLLFTVRHEICRKRFTPQIQLTRKARTLTDLPPLMVLTEKGGGVCFRQVGGKVDYAGFFGKDPTFYNWVKTCSSITGTKQNKSDDSRFFKLTGICLAFCIWGNRLSSPQWSLRSFQSQTIKREALRPKARQTQPETILNLKRITEHTKKLLKEKMKATISVARTLKNVMHRYLEFHAAQVC